ncbi:hypothetical protein FO519_007252 [Halicephalobus sp. NKZ332]|nr:hypothetical protein FO519_007252 [Halicephalobus sp. NKZ332]
MFSKLVVLIPLFLVAFGYPQSQGSNSDDMGVGSFYAALADNLTPEQKTKIEEIGNQAGETKQDIYDKIKQQFQSWGESDQFTEIENKFKSFLEDLKQKASNSPFVQKFISVVENESLTENQENEQIEDAFKSASESDVQTFKDTLSENFENIKDKLSSWFNSENAGK